jgi:hypothetical protein
MFIFQLSEAEFASRIADEVRRQLEASHDLLTLPEAALYLKVAKGGLYQRTCQKTIPHFKRNGKIYFLKSQLNEWIKQGQVMLVNKITEGQA